MKFFALCALFAAAAASICDQKESGAKNLDSTIIGIKIVIEQSFMAGCMPGGDTFSNFFFNNDNCAAIFNEGFCYSNVGQSKYAGYDEKTVSWDLIASGIPNAKAMGQVLCANAEACYSPVKEALLACYEDPVFAAAVAANAEDYFDAAQSAGSAYAADNQGAIAGSLTKMVVARFGSFQDAIAAYKENEDALMEAYNNVKDTAAEFCESECVEQTADYLVPFLGAIQDNKCKSVNKFCGRCKSNAGSYIDVNGIPCCLTDVIDAAISNIDDFKVTYASEIEAYTNEALEGVSAGEKKRAEKAYRELMCLRDMYTDRAIDCSDYVVA